MTRGDLAEHRVLAEGGRYTSRMALSTGQKFAGFTVLRLLGSGAMGEVYLVDHPRLPRREALKILAAAATSDGQFRHRFNREAELAAAMWHPHIVAVHDRGESNGQLWISMDYVEGTDAAALVRDRYPAGLPEYFAAEIVSAVADALDYAHERGLLHRDVKPANILLSDSDPAAQRRRILLTDFGIARPIDDDLVLTATNMAVGTIAYMAPEQLMGSSLDGRADQYALAASAFQLLTGKPPFESPSAVISSHLSESRPKLGQRRPDLGRFDPVISKGMATNPAFRFLTCRDFATAFGELIDSQRARDDATLPAAARFTSEQAPYPGTAPTAEAPMVGTSAKRASTAGSGGVPRDSGATVVSGRDRPPAADTKRRGRRRVWIAAALVGAVLLVAGGAVLTVRLTGKPSGAPGASAGAPSGLVPVSAVGGLLLGADQVHGIVGQQLQKASASSQTIDSSGGFNLPECSGAIYPLESPVYVPTQYTAVRGQLLQPSPTGNPFYPLVDQSVAMMPSADRAAQLLADSHQQWQNCAGKPLTVSSGNSTMKATLANVASQGDMISQNRTVADGASCQHTMAVWSNVVAEAVVCAKTGVDDESQQVAQAILGNARR
jgi:serine/threonine-protein kinase